ncbi:hypothetical protein KEJ18_01585 [Candidatus Bathyarchaeota archaeon]|nr:hypothetical protein [Candidatus Bathyarchaeota archaeon]
MEFQNSEKEKSGRTSVVTLALIVLLAASNIGVYYFLQSQITALTLENVELENSVADLTEEKTSLQNQVDALKDEKFDLQSQLTLLDAAYNDYRSTHSHMDDEYDELSQDYLDISSYYMSLSENVTELYDLLYSYSCIPDAFTRTLNDAEVCKTGSTVLSVTGHSTDLWSSEEKIYDYIVSNIDYVQDVDMPYPSTYWYINFDGFDYITEFTITEYRNYVQTPSLTLEIKQGDCDDQAVLTYAMIKYYMKYVHGTEYSLYLARIEFSDGEAHLAVILPVQGGEVCVIDPAGNYLTSSWYTIDSKPAQSELQTYSNYWWPAHITYIELYSVSVSDDSYSVAAEGTLSQVADFLAQD